MGFNEKPLGFYRERSKDLQHHLKSSPDRIVFGEGSHFFRFGGFPKPCDLEGGILFINPVLSLIKKHSNISNTHANNMKKQKQLL